MENPTDQIGPVGPIGPRLERENRGRMVLGA